MCVFQTYIFALNLCNLIENAKKITINVYRNIKQQQKMNQPGWIWGYAKWKLEK